MDIVASIGRVWKRIPSNIRNAKWAKTSLKAFVTRVYSGNCFAGNLRRLFEEYTRADPLERERIDGAIEQVVSHLLMPNGTLKATRVGRNVDVMNRALNYIRLNDSPDVLEIGGSLGCDSLQLYALLSRCVAIRSYTVGDLYTRILVDRERGLVFDADGRLLQIRVGGLIFNIFARPDTAGHPFIVFTRCISQYFQNRYVFIPSAAQEIPLIHPLLHKHLAEGKICFQDLDVVKPLSGNWSLIISFNLIDDEYFSDSQLLIIMGNLREGLRDGGYLVVGVSSCVAVYRKTREELRPVYGNTSPWSEKIGLIVNELNVAHEK